MKLESETAEYLYQSLFRSDANHECHHQGQLVVMFGRHGVYLSERFGAAFDL